MNEPHRSRLIIVALAILIPLIIEQGTHLLSVDMPHKTLFYGVTLAGAGCIAIATQLTAPILSSGLLFGGLIVIVRNYYSNWDTLDARMLFLTLLIALAGMIFLSMHSSERGGERKLQNRPPHGGASRPRRPNNTEAQKPTPRGPRPPQ